MRFLTRVMIPPFEYPIYITSKAIKIKGGGTTSSCFIAEQKIVIQTDIDESKLLRRLKREFYNAWSHHWPGPQSQQRMASFERWFVETVNTHLPPTLLKEVTIHAPVQIAEPTLRDHRPLQKTKPKTFFGQGQKPVNKTDHILKKMDITNF